jgi:hypothetical protein
VVEVTSAFQGGTEGWTIDGDATVSWEPAGHLVATDQGLGVTWHFQAPAKFLGDLSVAYGRLFRFELKQSVLIREDQVYDRGVIFFGVSKQLWYSMGNPNTVWTQYSIAITEAAGGWMLGSNISRSSNPASKDDIREALSAVSKILIRGEFHVGGGDVGSLDNVKLERE